MSVIVAEYGVTADSLLGARVDDLAYIAVPVREGFRLASGWRLDRPIAIWSQGDVFGSEGIVADEAAFRAHINAVTLRLNQRRTLGRKEARLRVSTPWGMSQGATVYAQGVVFHSTASHGGFKLDRARNAGLHPALRIKGGWYEEDGDWARIAHGYPDLFTDQEKAQADRTLRDWAPDAWEAVHGRALTADTSFTRDREQFERDHAGDWVVIAAVRSDRYPGFVETIATIGGRRERERTRSFLVSDDDYAPGRHGFVIDSGRHEEMPAA